MRIAAISLPELCVEVAAHQAKAPLAIVVAPPPITEAKLLGNTRIDVVSREARARGVRPGQTIAQARARAGDLAVRVVRPEAVEGELARLAEVALAFGATVSFQVGSNASDGVDSFGNVVWVDVTGCAHLHASNARDGEVVLASRLSSIVEGFGHSCTVAIADGPRVSAILARAAAESQQVESLHAESRKACLIVVPQGQNAAALAPLSVSYLPLPSEAVRWLAKIGVRTIAELRALPRAALASRLGARAPLVLCLADGEDRAPLTPYVPPEIPEEEASLEYGIEGSEALSFVAKTLCDRLASRLAGRAMAAARVELDLAIDVALLEGDEKRDKVQRIAIDLPAPLSAASDLLAALRPKIERAVLRAPVLGAKLRAASLVHKPRAVLSLFEPQPRANALPRLVAELASDLGEEAVGKLSLGDAWTPEDRSRFVSLARQGTPQRDLRGGKRRRLLSSIPEPTRISSEPVAVPREAVKIVRHLSRLEAVDWWKHLPGEGSKKGVDYVYAWVDDGAAWVEIDRASGSARVRGWFD